VYVISIVECIVSLTINILIYIQDSIYYKLLSLKERIITKNILNKMFNKKEKERVQTLVDLKCMFIHLIYIKIIAIF